MEDILCNSIQVKRFVNTPVPSVTYLLVNIESGHCIVIDPGSKEEPELRDYIQEQGLKLDAIGKKQSWLSDFSANITANAAWDTIIYFASRILKNIK